MKRIFISSFSIFVASVVALAATKTYLDHWSYMNVNEAEKRWGGKSFSVESFKKGPTSERAAEAADLLKKQALVGKTADEVVETLGQTSGYFWSDRFPTYFIEEGGTKKKDSWQIVFLRCR